MRIEDYVVPFYCVLLLAAVLSYVAILRQHDDFLTRYYTRQLESSRPRFFWMLPFYVIFGVTIYVVFQWKTVTALYAVNIAFIAMQNFVLTPYLRGRTEHAAKVRNYLDRAVSPNRNHPALPYPQRE